MQVSFKEERGADASSVPVRCLQIATAAMCVGVAWRALAFGDVVFSFLFLSLDWSEQAALRVTHASGYAMLFAAVLGFWRRAWPMLIAVSVWMAVLASLSMLDQPDRAALIPAGHAIRILVPFALALWIAVPRWERAVVVLLQLATAATFAGHGIEALWHEPAFLDYIFMAGMRVGLEVSQASAERLLTGIGMVDLLVAVGILAGPIGVRTRFAWYMAAWGLLTACSRIVHSGFESSWEALLRVPHGGVPLALAIYWRSMRRGPQ